MTPSVALGATLTGDDLRLFRMLLESMLEQCRRIADDTPATHALHLKLCRLFRDGEAALDKIDRSGVQARLTVGELRAVASALTLFLVQVDALDDRLRDRIRELVERLFALIRAAQPNADPSLLG